MPSIGAFAGIRCIGESDGLARGVRGAVTTFGQLRPRPVRVFREIPVGRQRLGSERCEYRGSLLGASEQLQCQTAVISRARIARLRSEHEIEPGERLVEPLRRYREHRQVERRRQIVRLDCEDSFELALGLVSLPAGEQHCREVMTDLGVFRRERKGAAQRGRGGPEILPAQQHEA
jgi:hypothetical protein